MDTAPKDAKEKAAAAKKRAETAREELAARAKEKVAAAKKKVAASKKKAETAREELAARAKEKLAAAKEKLAAAKKKAETAREELAARAKEKVAAAKKPAVDTLTLRTRKEYLDGGFCPERGCKSRSVEIMYAGDHVPSKKERDQRWRRNRAHIESLEEHGMCPACVQRLGKA